MGCSKREEEMEIQHCIPMQQLVFVGGSLRDPFAFPNRSNDGRADGAVEDCESAWFEILHTCGKLPDDTRRQARTMAGATIIT